MTTKITMTEAEKIFAGITGCSFVRLDTCTIPKLSGGKSNPHFGNIKKYSSFVAFCGKNVSYENMVNNRLKGEYKDLFGEKPVDIRPFEAKALWKGKGEHLNGAVIRHVETDERYISVFVPSNTVPTVEYLYEGKGISKDDIQGLNTSDDTKTAEVDGVDISIKLVTHIIKIESIKGFKIDGIEYEIL